MKFKLISVMLTLCCGLANAQNVMVKDAWARPTVAGQQATGVFMNITTKDGGTLMSASSPLGVAQVHEMKMDGGVMKMRAVAAGVPLPAGKTVEFKPGGYHVMLMDLKAPLEMDALVPLTLVVKNAKGGQSTIEMKVKVANAAPAGKTADHNHH